MHMPQTFQTQIAEKRRVQDREGSRVSKRASGTTPQSQRRKSEGTSRTRKAHSPEPTVHIGTLFSKERERLSDLDYRLAVKVRESLRSEERAEHRGPSGGLGGLQGKKTNPAATILKFFAKEQT